MGLLKKTLKYTAVTVLTFLVFITLAAFLYTFNFWVFLKTPGSSTRAVRELTIKRGENAKRIAHLLYSQGLIADEKKFYLLCLLRKSGHKLQAGEYAFTTLSTPEEILNQMVTGKVVLHRITIPEGSTVSDVANILNRSKLASRKEILRLSRDREYIKSLGMDVPYLEGYLFPETYFFSKSQNPKEIIETMVRQFWLHFPPSWRDRAKEMNLEVGEVVILASMVEKEAAVDSERPLIAAVFFNRLRRNMLLQSDPTAIYDLEDFSGPITREHLKRQSPYNTYQNKGLPVGPICNPGAKSMEAVLFPADVPYLYFVSNKDGTHSFSVTLMEHLKAVSAHRTN